MESSAGSDKAVYTFNVGEEDEAPTLYAFMHGLSDANLMIQVLRKNGQPKPNVRYTIQDENVVIVESQLGFSNGDRIIVRR